MRLRGVYQVSTEKERVQILGNLIEEGSQDPKIREASLIILKNCKGRDYLCELKAIFNWMKQNFVFRGDVTGRDSYHSPRRLLTLMCGDCDDSLILAGSLAASVGYPILIKIISQDKNKPFHHIYPLAGVPPDKPTRWYAMDITRPGSSFGSEPRYTKSRVYKVIFE